MEKAKIIIRYWGLIIAKTVQFAVLFEEIRGEVASILRGLLINALAILGIGSISGQPVEIIPIAYWTGVLILGRFFLGLIYFPAKLYTDKKRDANKLTFTDVEIKPFRFPRGSGYGIGIKLVSDKQSNLNVTGVLAKLGSVKRGSTEMLDNELQYNIQLPILIGSGSHFERDNRIINRGDKNSFAEVSAIPIASWDNEKAWVLSDNEQGKCVDLEPEVSHRLTISIDGAIATATKFFNLEGCGVWCDLMFQKNWRGGRQVSLKLHARNPKYEQ